MKQIPLKLALMLSASLYFMPLSAHFVDEDLFVKPHLPNLAGQVAFDAGQRLTADKAHSFEQAISLNIGKNIPSTTHIISKDDCRIVGLGAHMRGISESLQQRGKAVIVTPASYGVVFTDGTKTETQVHEHIKAVLAKIGSSEERHVIASALDELNEVHHATFVRRENKFKLITEEKALHIGDVVWRKTPTGSETNIYHSEEEYLVAIKNAGLVCEEVKRPCFFGEVKWKAYNNSVQGTGKTLGAAYMNNHPYTLFYVSKKS